MESIDHFVHVCVVGRGHFVKGTFVGGGLMYGAISIRPGGI